MPTQTITSTISDKKANLKSSISSQVNSLNIPSFKQIFADHAPKAIKTKESTEIFSGGHKQAIQTNNSESIENNSAGKAEEKTGSYESTNEIEKTKQDQVTSSENSLNNLRLKVDESIPLDLNVVELVDLENVNVNDEATDLKEEDNVLVEQDESVNDSNASEAKVNNTASIVVKPSENKSLGDISNDKVALEVSQDEIAKDDQKKTIEDVKIEKVEIEENNQAVNPQIIQIFDETLNQNKNDIIDSNLNTKNLNEGNKNFNKGNEDLSVIINENINEEKSGNISLDKLTNKASENKNISGISGVEKKDATKVKEQPQLAESILKNSTDLQDGSTIKSDLQEGANNGQNFEQQNIPDLGKITFDNEKLNISFKEVANNFSDNIPHRADQISLAIKAGVQNGRKEISINMYPETLGNVDVKLEFNKDQIVAIKIFAEKAETLNILIKDIAVLEKLLSEVVKADDASLSFNLKDGQNGNEYGPANKQVNNNRAVADDESTTITKNYQINKLSSQSDGVDIRV